MSCPSLNRKRLAITKPSFKYKSNPTLGENVKTNLTANRKSQSKMQKLSLELGDHVSPNTMLLVILFKIDSLLDGCVSADRGDVDHTVSKFDKRASVPVPH